MKSTEIKAGNLILNEWMGTGKVRYHAEWERLMEVIERMDGIRGPTDMAWYNIRLDKSMAYVFDGLMQKVSWTIGDNRKEAAFRICVAFAKILNGDNPSGKKQLITESGYIYF